jgi:hypothetical protein
MLQREGGAEGVSELSPGFESRAETTNWMNLPCSAVERKSSKSILWPLQGERETYRAHPAEQLRQRRGGRPRPGGGGAASSTSLKQFKRHEMVREMSWRRWARPRGRYKIGNLAGGVVVRRLRFADCSTQTTNVPVHLPELIFSLPTRTRLTFGVNTAACGVSSVLPARFPLRKRGEPLVEDSSQVRLAGLSRTPTQERRLDPQVTPYRPSAGRLKPLAEWSCADSRKTSSAG